MFKRFCDKNLKGITVSKFECVRDNLTIRGTEYRPSGEKLPIAIVSHGFMAFQDTIRHYAIELAKLGYISYCFDFCGGSVIKGKSDGKTTDMSVLTEVKDLEAVLAYTKNKSYTNENDVLLMGCSQGGFVSGILASKLKEQITKLVLFYPALCIPDDARKGHMMFAKFDPNNIPNIVNCGPMKLGKCYVSDVLNMDPYEELKGYTGKVLIVHGTDDKIVNIEYSKKAHDCYENNGAEVSFHIIEKGAHGFSKQHDVIAIELLKQFATNE